MMKENEFEEVMISLTDIVDQLGVKTSMIGLKSVEYDDDSDCTYVTIMLQPYTTLQSVDVEFTLTPDGVDWGDPAD